MKNRMHEWDFLKGFLVIMIILGHTTASFGTYEKVGVLNYLSSITVSFIMPLFLIITGYFIYPQNTIVKWKVYVKKKAKRLLFPAITWGIMGDTSVLFLLIQRKYNFIEICKSIYWNIRYLWYLYAVFAVSLIVLFIECFCTCKLLMDKKIVYFLVMIGMLFIPSDLWYINFSFQFIMVGCFLRKDGFSFRWVNENKRICLLIAALYLVMVVFFPYDFSVYVAGTNLITNVPLGRQIWIVCFRFFIGIAGSVAVTFLLIELYNYCNYLTVGWIKTIMNRIELIGENSLEMYCLQFVLVERVFAFVMEILSDRFGISFTRDPYVCYFVWRHFFGIAFVIITFTIVEWLKHKKISGYLF